MVLASDAHGRGEGERADRSLRSLQITAALSLVGAFMYMCVKLLPGRTLYHVSTHTTAWKRSMAVRGTGILLRKSTGTRMKSKRSHVGINMGKNAFDILANGLLRSFKVDQPAKWRRILRSVPAENESHGPKPIAECKCNTSPCPLQHDVLQSELVGWLSMTSQRGPTHLLVPLLTLFFFAGFFATVSAAASSSFASSSFPISS